MRRTTLVLLLACTLLFSAAAGLAETPAEAIETPVTAPAPAEALSAVGTTHHGFTVKEHFTLDNLNADCAYMVHDRTGAQLIYVACEDTDRAFDITFLTPAADDKGIPHVFEHATLCGSKKYPDPSLFFNMMYQTYNTYLNAMTAQTCTTFPASSLSEDQLYVFADYLLSGVFNPLIMTDERAMMREAYRYELTDADADITLNGTVYSEMRGALSINSAGAYNLKKILYPGSITANLSGGDPAVIPDLTHQELKDFHDNYYHPSNSLITLYGKLDCERFLKLIDEEYLSGYEYRAITLSDDAYVPFEGFREQTFTFPVAADAVVQPIAMYGYSLKDATAEDEVLMSIIATALGNESSPLIRRGREALPNATIFASMDDNTTDPTLTIMGLNISEADKDTFRRVVDEAIAEVLAEGLDMNAIASQCRRQHYSDVITRGQAGTSYTAVTNIGMAWGMTQDPFAYKKMMDVKANLMHYVETDAFNEVFKRLMTSSVRSALAVTLPDVGGLEKQSEAIAQRLAEKKAAMTDAEIDALVAKTADFNAWTQGNQVSEMIKDVKVVSVQTLPEEIVRYEAEDRVIDGMRVVTAEVPLDDVIQVNLRFDAASVPFELLQEYATLAGMITSMPTENYSETALADALADTSYMASIICDRISYKEGGYHPMLNASFLTTRDKLDDIFALVEEMLCRTDFSNTDLFRRVLREKVANDKMMSKLIPDLLLSGYGKALVDDEALYSNYLSGDANTLFQQKVAEMSDEEVAALAARMLSVRDMLLNRNGVILTCVGTRESIDETIARASAFCAKLPDEKREPIDYTPLIPRLEAPLACVIDGTVQYNMMVASMKDSGFAENGKMLAMNRLVSDKILLQVLRFQNSAYGAGGHLDGKLVLVSSYRDPNLATTYDVFATLGDRIRALELTQDDLDGYITGAYAGLASPFSALAGGAAAVSDALTGETTFDDYLSCMREIKEFCLEDVTAYAAVYDMLAEKGFKATVGGAEAIEQNREMFKTVLTTFVD